MRKLIVFAWIMSLVLSTFSEDFDEAALFNDTAVVTGDLIDTSSIVANKEKNTAFSGAVISAIDIDIPFKNPSTPSSFPSITADISLDARLLGGIKGFLSGEAVYFPNSDSASTSFTMPETFIDFNFNRKLYLRTGKQVLQWGRGYLWNPTDLINVERKHFIQKIGLREGAYGVKAHIPFGTRMNLYAFADLRNADSLAKTALSFKSEFTVKATEMAFAVWHKKGKMPVFGYDISTGLGKTAIAGEISLYRMDNEMVANIDNGVLRAIKGKEEWSEKAALTLTRSFDFNGIPNRVTLVLEGYYNGSGYNASFIKEAVKCSTVTLSPAIPPTDAIMYALSTGLYRPNELSKYYVALFGTFSRFINSNLSLSLNAIGNIEQSSVYLNSTLSYADIRDLSLSLSVSGGIGPKNSEYTLDIRDTPVRHSLSTRLSATISF